MNTRQPILRGALAAAIATLLCATAGAADSGGSKALPRLADGHPDFNGTWDNGDGYDFLKAQKGADGSICLLGCAPQPGAAAPAAPAPAAAAPAAAAPLKPERPLYRPQFQAKVQDLDKRQVQMDPVLRCKSPGLPRIGPPDKIVQRPGEMAFLYDDVSGSFWRIIPTDGRKHRTDADESYLGDAVGHWEGDTLVIETVNFNDDSWLTDDGSFHTKDLRVTERLSRSGDTMTWLATADDPKVLAQPWVLRPRPMKLNPNELPEPAPCVEQDLDHMVDDTSHDNPR
ncbi:MAG TPA: hypothetical protein VGO53_10480 [Steroidobacteraceae bacterium]|jgi:hypothetical protein|nr:hypothetical protein [Steroidobacteraceae bacterium]